jgi:hypothetical protein
MPIKFAHFYIENKSYGSISNEKGEFSLNFDKYLDEELITISCVGYNTRKIPLYDLTKNQYNKILLSPSSKILNEVTIVAQKKDTLRAYLNSVLKSVKINYPKHKYILDAFFRELSIKDSVYTRLIEAAITIMDNGYGEHDFEKEDLSTSNLKIKVQSVRKSDDMRTYSVFGKVLELLFGKENNLYKTLRDDLIRYIGHRSDHYLSNEMLKIYEYELKEIYNTKEGRIFVIQLSDQYMNSFYYREVTLYINDNDKAIIKFKNILRPNPNDPNGKKYTLNDDFFSKSEVTYEKYKGKYYLSYIDAWYYSSGATAVLDGKNSEEVSLQFDHFMLMVNAVYNQNDEITKIKKRDSIKKDIDLYEAEFEYDSLFWKTYNTVLLDTLNRKVRVDLEKKSLLESQYKSKNKK